MENKVYISNKIEKKIFSHVNKVYELSVKTPIMLGIFGTPGEGKTFQCEKIIEKYDWGIVKLASNVFESKDAGEPMKIIDQIYNNTLNKFKTTGKKQVILIDDIDTLIGNWGGLYQYTVNTQHIIKYFMELSDKMPLQHRIPIIFTGNDLTKIYSPLKRHGRMSYLTWCPNFDEKINILSTIVNLKNNELKRLVKEMNKFSEKNHLKTPSIAFYVQLKNEIIDDIIWEKQGVIRNNLDYIFHDINYNKWHDYGIKLLEEEKSINKSYA